ncbi:MAG: phosphatase PAP2 family protein [Bryobacteraceae bacterium]|jgi:membrane-associated phospholipid phosphatase
MQSPCLRLVCLLLAASAAFPWGAGAAGGDRTEEAESLRPLVKRLARNIGQDQKRIWTSPFRITRKNARWWLTFGAATGLLIATDSRTSRQLPNTADQVAFSRHVSQVGAVYTLIPTACGLYLSGLLAHDAKLRETGLLGGEALADALIVSEVLKLAAGRQRPLEADGGGHFFHAGTSFPSGHAIESFALASVISHRYGNRKAVAVLAYGLAGLVSASRFSARKHFASDILAGGAMGWFIGRHVSETHQDRSRAKRPPARAWLAPQVIPQVQPAARSYGISLVWHR